MLLTIRVVKRMLSTTQGERVQPVSSSNSLQRAPLSIIVPVLNEYNRLTLCLEGLLTQGQEVAEILVVDGGSHDGTQALIQIYIQRDGRIRMIDASPIPSGWNGKAWGLQVGFQQVAASSDWILTLDADVHPTPLLACSLLAHAQKTGLSAFSIATLQKIEGTGQGFLHPSLLTTLVYRFGSPGHPIHKIHEVQANGQCFLCRRSSLERLGGFACARDSICEDITIARALVAAGQPVGFYEAGELISVEMYQSWQETWLNWTRSLSLHDRFSGSHTLYGWLEVVLVQALPLPLFCWLMLCWRRNWGFILLNGFCVCLRVGVLFGTARAYQRRPWSYWLSPLCDLPVALKLGVNTLKRQHTWRGRTIIRGGLK